MRSFRHALRRTAVGALWFVLIAGLLLGLALRRPPRFAVHEVERRLALAIHRESPPAVRIGRLRIDLRGGAVTAEDVEIAARAGLPPAVRIDAARVDLALRSLAPLSIEVTRITVVRPRVTWSEEIGLVLLRGPAESEADQPFPALRIVGGAMEGVFPEVGWIQASDIELDARANPLDGSYHARLSLDVPSAGRIAAEGRLDPERRTYEVFAQGDALRPDPRDLPWLSETARKLYGEYEPRGTLDLRASMRGSLDGQPQVSAAVRFHDLSLRLPGLDERMQTASGIARLDVAGNAQLRARATVRGATVDVEAYARDVLSGDPAAWIAAATPEPLTYEPWVRELFVAIDGPHAELDAFSARGRARVAVFLARRPGERGLRTAAEIEVLDARARFVGFPRDPVSFPYPVAELAGHISFRPGTLLTPGILGRGPTGTIELEGLFRFARGKSPGLDFAARLGSARIDEDLDRAVRGLPEVAEVWSDLAPHGGRVEAELLLSKRLGEPRLSTLGQVLVHGAEATYRSFPLPTGALTGRVGIADEGISFRFDGVADPRGASRAPFELEGALNRFAPGQTGVAGFGLEARTRGLRFGPALLEALAGLDPSAARALGEFGYDGELDLVARIVRPAGSASAALEAEIEIGLRGGALSRDRLGSDLREVRGLLRVRSKGSQDASPRGAHVHGWALGRVARSTAASSDAPDTEGFADGLLTLEAHAHPLGLDVELAADFAQAEPEDLRAAVERAESLPAIHELRLEGGSIDADLALLHRAGQPPELRAELDLDGVDVQIAGWVAPLRDVRGQLSVLPHGRIRAGEIRLEVPHAEGEGATRVVLRDAQVEDGGRALRAAARVAVEELALDRHLEVFLGRSGAARFQQWRGTGRARAERLDVRLRFPRVSEDSLGSPDVEFEGRVQLDGVRLDPGIAIEELSGELEIVRGRVTPLGVEEIEAEVRGGALSVFGIGFREIATRLRLDPQRFETVRRARAEVLGGSLGPLELDGPEEPRTFAIDLGSEQPRFEVNLEVQDAELQRLLSEIEGRTIRAPGAFDARLEIAGPVRDLGRVRGTTNLRLREGELGTLPVLGRLNPLLGQEAVTFRTARAAARLEGLIVRVDDLRLDSPAAELSGRGAIGLDGTIALAIDITYLDILGVPIFGSILARGLGMILATAPLVHIEVGGWIDAPQIYPQFGPTGRAALQLAPRPYLPPRAQPKLDRRF